MAQTQIPASKMERYGCIWPATTTPIAIEMAMIRRGGRWKGKDGRLIGEGLFFHYKAFQSLLWPEKIWHKWTELELECWLKYRIIGEVGPASSGKTFSGATNMLADYFVWSDCTTVLVSSTTKESLEMRVWGEIKKYHRMAKTRYPWLAGNLIEGRQRIVTDSRAEASEGRDFRNGLVGVACKKGGNYQGLAEYVGIKNKRLRLLADELQFMPPVFIDAIANLNKNPDFKGLGLGNCKDTGDALGKLCEPAAELGGWDGGIDQTPGTKTWAIRFPSGICIQLPGSDSPNLDGKLNCPLITQAKIDEDIAFYGKDSIQYTMMDEGRMPRGMGSRRVITRQMCLKFGAMELPVWGGGPRTKIGFLDAAYKGVGGDRCIFGELQFGNDVEGRQILALIETLLIPLKDGINEMPEDQIVDFVMSQCEQREITPENFGYDSTGRGTLGTAFGRKWSANVNPIEFGGAATESRRVPLGNGTDISCKDYFFNFVSELWYSSRWVVESSQFRGMTDDVMGEGCQREWMIVGKNKIQVEPKEQMKLKTGRSPDLYDGLVTGIEMARRRGFVIERLRPINAGKKGKEDWKRALEERARRLASSGALTYSS
jgi:hypothetical protein